MSTNDGAVSPAQDIKGAVLRGARNGAVFTVVGIGLSQSLRLGSNLVLVQFLEKEAFGLMGLSLTIGFAIAMLTDIGINSSIVRSNAGDDPGFLRTAWTTAIARNTLVYLCVLVIALGLWVFADSFPSDSIYGLAVLPLFVAVTGTSVLIGGFVSTRIALCQRRQTLGILVVYEVTSQIIAAVVMISAAVLGAGYWSLAIGAITGSLSNVILSHTMVPGPAMRFEWHRRHFDEIFSFGKWLLIASAFGFVLNKGDQLIFSALFTSETFSLYVVGGLWIIAIIGVSNNLLGRVCYPALSSMTRNDAAQLDTVYRRFRHYADGLAILAFTGIVFLSGPFFEFFYPDSYQGAVVFIRILSVSLLLLPYRLINSIILAGGDSRRYSIITMVPACVMMIALPVGYHLGGAEIAALVFSLIQVTTLPFSWIIGAKRLSLSFWIEARMVTLAISAAVMLAL